jgi:hypothetical protein
MPFCRHFFPPSLVCSSLCSLPAETQSNLPGNNFVNTSELSYFERDKWDFLCDQFRFDFPPFFIQFLKNQIPCYPRHSKNGNSLPRIDISNCKGN